MSIFNMAGSAAQMNELYKNDQKAKEMIKDAGGPMPPSASEQRNKFIATIADKDLIRSNIYFVIIQKHTMFGQVTIGDDQESLNGLTDNDIFDQGMQLAGTTLVNQGTSYAKSVAGPYGGTLVQAGMGDMYDTMMGIESGSYDAKDFDPSKTMGLYAADVTLPGINIEVEAEYAQQQQKALFIKSKSMDGLSITFRCSNNMAEYKYLHYLTKQYVDDDHNRVAFPDDFVLPEISVFIYNKNTQSIATALLKDSVVTSLSSINLNYENSDEVLTFSAEFKPRSYEFISYPPVADLSSYTSLLPEFGF